MEVRLTVKTNQEEAFKIVVDGDTEAIKKFLDLFEKYKKLIE